MSEDQPVKRRPGNPNWVKKTPDTPKQEKTNDSEVWLQVFSAILTGHQTLGPSLIRAAATNADLAVNEYNARFKS